ncbi:MAG: LemA family protein [bacterium]
MNILYIILVAVAIVVVWLIFTYNGLIRSRNRVDESFSDIDVQLKRRYDLIPNLVETVKGYVKHESETFEKVVMARNQAMAVNNNREATMEERGNVENMLTNTLKSLFALSEAYPDLKANQNFLQLQDEISDTENKIQASRRFYNGNVRDFNTKIQVFPTNLIAKSLKFVNYDFFQAQSEEKENIKMKF